MQVAEGYQGSWRSSTSEFSVAAIDLGCILGLVLLTLVMLLWNYQGLPLQYWDESRNANNALEMLRGSSWWIPTYNGQIDHWNTKPPLLIWLMAGLMKLGLPPLLAVRLPSALAACATLVVVWASLRFGLRDRFAALVAACLLLSSRLYTGIHGAHTGDYDTLLGLFTTGYVLSMWQALVSRGATRNRWIICTAFCVVLAVMTKGPAGAFGVVGLGLFLVLSRQLVNTVKEWRWWLAATSACAICAAYYVTREHYDPDYLQAVWLNEIGGRYGHTIEANFYGRWFYLSTLFKHFIPGALCLLLIGFSLRSANPARKALAQVTFFSGMGIVALLASAQTQLYWYLLPALPLLAIAGALAAVDTIRRFRWRAGAITLFCVAFLALPLLISVYKNAFSLQASASEQRRISQYGVVFKALHTAGYLQGSLTAIDNGVDNTAGFVNYNPELQFYQLLEQQKGVDIQVAPLESVRGITGLVASCDYKNTLELRKLLNRILFDNSICVAGIKVS